MKVLKVIKNIIIGILFIAFFSFAIAMTVLMLNVNSMGLTQFGDRTLVYIRGSVASENYNSGDLVIVEKPPFRDLEIGDEVFTYRITRGVPSVEVGIVGDVHPEDTAISFENGATFGYAEFVIGRAADTYPNIGGYLAVIQSQWGFLFIVLVPAFLIFIYQLYALIVEIKYGKYETRD